MEKHTSCIIFFALALLSGQQLHNGAWAQRSFRNRGPSVTSSSFITSGNSYTPFRRGSALSPSTAYTSFGSSSGTSYSPVSADGTSVFAYGDSTYEPHTFGSRFTSTPSSFGSSSMPVSESDVGSVSAFSSSSGSTYVPRSFTGSSIAASDSYAVSGSGRRGRNGSSFVLSNDRPSSIVSSTDAFAPFSGSFSVGSNDFGSSYAPRRSSPTVMSPSAMSSSSFASTFHHVDDTGAFVSTYAPNSFNSGMGVSESFTGLEVRPVPAGDETAARTTGGASRHGSSAASQMAAPGSPTTGSSNGSVSRPSGGTTTTTAAPTAPAGSQGSANTDSSSFEGAREMPGDVIVEERDGEFIYFFVEEDGRRTQLENAPPLEEMEPDSFFTEQYLLDKPIKLLDHEQQERMYKARTEKPTNATRISLTSPTGETNTLSTREERQDGAGLMALPPRQRELGLL
ncbi:conserved hypothetical protein [Neospora caninum Liverpool]|uniref:Uncharacterized protein n=1 Tax=Neospora caninum (strain Liverpool) TaxID=572307 RepID=F0V9T5_NEOCL|nr:conserved hypothetical protein [Neospora caninum Liverpool]CBZ50246.1 conserved hypothetical protein [Neospora caninum Liverpool]CEL64847.1 TPA: hypothetical protein BN1204_007200 [Neospora caninum Liverpool]|eukprot:XP_003880281.1 conserved hypothetical protein [Neospora caninum Liverpool]